MSKGVCNAFSEAEEQCQKEKSKKKMKNYKKVFKENASEILAEELISMLAQLRINMKTLSDKQKEILRRNISSSFETSLRTSTGIPEDAKSILLDNENQDFIQQRVDSLDKRLLSSFSTTITPEQRINFILANVLSRTPVDSVERADYFFQNNASRLVSSNKRKTFERLSKKALVNFEISGIKDVNDTYGHTECDKMIYSLVSRIQKMTDSLGIKKDSVIFANNISSYGFLIPEGERKKVKKLNKAISALDSKFKVAVSSSKLGEKVDTNALSVFLNNEDKNSEDLLLYLLDAATENNSEQNKRSISLQKINDKTSMVQYISRNLRRITKTVGKKLDRDMINLALNQVLGERVGSTSKPNTENEKFQVPVIDME